MFRRSHPHDPRQYTIATEANPTSIPAPERVAYDRRSRADALFADMLREESGSYVTSLRARAAALVQR